jgi:Type II secretory pathway, component ExeA (predicted ATPase)
MEPGSETQVYLQYFGLHTDPFALTPDPAFLYLSPGHAEGLAGLKLGLYERRGLIAMIGEVGTGKTTILYSLLSGLGPNIQTAYIANTTLSFDGILRTALRDFGLPHDCAERSELLAILNSFLLDSHKQGKTVALIVDEAQNLSDSAFEELRLLSNYETYKAKLLQIILVGQPELEAKLSSNKLRQVNERIAVRCYINPLSRREARRYVDHRIRAAGGSLDLFTPAAVRLAVERSRGIPRRINILCHNALLFAYGRGMHRVTRSVMAAAAREREGGGLVHVATPRQRRWRRDHSYGWRHSAMTWALGGVALGIACALVVVSSPIWKQQKARRNTVVATPTARAAAHGERVLAATVESTYRATSSPAPPAHQADRRRRRRRRIEASATRPPIVSSAPNLRPPEIGLVQSQASSQTASAGPTTAVVIEKRTISEPERPATAAANAQKTPGRRPALHDRTVVRPTSEQQVEAPKTVVRSKAEQPAGDQKVLANTQAAEPAGPQNAAAVTTTKQPVLVEKAASPPELPTEPVRTTQNSASAGTAGVAASVPVDTAGESGTTAAVSFPVPAAVAPASEAQAEADSSVKPQPVLQTIVVPQGKTLSELTLAVYGRFDRKLLRQLQDVNPSIQDPNAIRAGDHLLFPALSLPQDTSRGGTRTDE